jgi:hypothetical protein
MLKRLTLLLLVCSLPVHAVPPSDLEPLPDIPPPPPAADTPPAPTGLEDEGLEPEVKIIKRDDAVVHEYRAASPITCMTLTVTARWNPGRIGWNR